MVGPVLYEPRDAARDDQLRNVDHRAPRPRESPAHEHPRAGLGDPRLHDRLDRAGAVLRAPVRPVRAQAGLRRRLRGLRARVARRRVRDRRDAADPLARPPGARRRVPVRQLRGARHRRVPARAARARDGDQHDGGRDRAGDRPGARWRAGRDLVAVGVLVQRPARAARVAVGVLRAPRAGQAGSRARLRHSRMLGVRGRAHGARVRLSRGGTNGWTTHRRSVGSSPAWCCCRCSC